MKKILLLSILVLITCSCYDDFRRDYDTTSVAFSTASGDASDSDVLSRTVVLGEGLNLDIGVYLAGILENDEERWVEYEIDRTLLNDTDYEMMPESYYSLSDGSRFIIPSGNHVGSITVDLDSTQFVNDSLAMTEHYAIPFRLTGTSVDSILSTQATKILVVKYMSEYAGFYNQSGLFTTYDASGTEINSGEIDNVLEVTTVDKHTVRTNGLINQIGKDYRLDINISDVNDLSIGYVPDPTPPEVANIAVQANPTVTTSFVSGWESLSAVNDESIPPSSNSADYPKYGNWPEGVNWQWVQYEFQSTFRINSTDIFWFEDAGGVQRPTNSYIEYKDEESGNFIEIPNSEVPYQLNTFNTVEFSSPIITNTLRINMVGGRTNDDGIVSAGTGIYEWQVNGFQVATTPEGQQIDNVEATNDGLSYDNNTYSFTMKYRVNFQTGDYSIVESQMVWRNRIRDGVNEWRR